MKFPLRENDQSVVQRTVKNRKSWPCERWGKRNESAIFPFISSDLSDFIE